MHAILSLRQMADPATDVTLPTRNFGDIRNSAGSTFLALVYKLPPVCG